MTRITEDESERLMYRHDDELPEIPEFKKYDPKFDVEKAKRELAKTREILEKAS